jgi:formate dehydrogenase assembly factor FdhD
LSDFLVAKARGERHREVHVLVIDAASRFVHVQDIGRHHPIDLLLAHAIRNGELSQAARLIANEPRLLVTIPRRLVRQVQYQTHRLAHGGRRR